MGDSYDYPMCYPENDGVVAVDRDSYLSNGKLKISSGYIKRGLESLPWTGTKAPWTPLVSYISDKKMLHKGAIEDGVLQFDCKILPFSKVFTASTDFCSSCEDLESTCSENTCSENASES